MDSIAEAERLTSLQKALLIKKEAEANEAAAAAAAVEETKPAAAAAAASEVTDPSSSDLPPGVEKKTEEILAVNGKAADLDPVSLKRPARGTHSACCPCSLHLFLFLVCSGHPFLSPCPCLSQCGGKPIARFRSRGCARRGG